MFIPVNAKADIEGSKKGKITPAQNAVINAWSLASKSGILIVGDKCEAERMVYSAVGDTATVFFKHGFFVVYGRLVEVEAGSTVTIKLPSLGTERGNIIAKFKLDEMQEQEFSVFATTAPLVQQDLTSESGTECDFVLYEYEATNNGVTLLDRPENVYFNSTQEEFNQLRNYVIIEDQALRVALGNGILVPAVAQYARDYSSDGNIAYKLNDIERRLAESGFRQGSVSGLAGATLTAMGKYAILSLPSVETNRVSGKNINLDLSFAPAESFSLTVYGSAGGIGVLAFTAGRTTVTYSITGAPSSGKSVFPAQQIGYKVI